MKKLLYLLLLPAWASADQFVQFDNGASGWRSDNGVVYGVSGGVDNGSGGFSDVESGERYQHINGSQSVGTRSGQVILDGRSAVRGNRPSDDAFGED